MEYLKLRDVLRKTKTIKKQSASRLKCIKIAFLRSYTVEKIIPYLEFYLVDIGFLPQFYFSDYGNCFQETLNTNSGLYNFSPDIIIIARDIRDDSEKLSIKFSSLTSNEVEHEINRLISDTETLVKQLSTNLPSSYIFVHNYTTPQYPSYGIMDYQYTAFQINTFRKMNLKIVSLCEKHKNINIIDVDYLQRYLGTQQSLNDLNWYLDKNPYSQNFLQVLTNEYIKHIKSLTGRVKKCLVLDLDNTLWGGIIGEDGMDGIKIGSSYPGNAFLNFQESILSLYHRGVILSICSKNNIEDVMEVLNEHPEMKLKPKHFTIIKANWEDKAKNLASISKELNIGLDSIVFVDDNLFEIELVKSTLPEVETVLIPKNPSEMSHIINEHAYFDSLFLSCEDKQKSQMYRDEFKRKEAKRKFSHLNEYLDSLNMKVQIHANDKFLIARTAQMTQKTNQFNLTSKRYSEGDILRFVENNNADVITISLKDDIGELGIIGAAILLYNNNEANIDSFMLSCRALGRSVERVLLHTCINFCLKKNIKTIKGQYIQTKRNQQVSSFYQSNGFKQTEHQSYNTKTYILKEESFCKINMPPHFEIINNRDNNESRNRVKESV